MKNGRDEWRNNGCPKCAKMTTDRLCPKCEIEMCEAAILSNMNRIEQLKKEIQK
jgi:hypothetical protein